jgi:hypothetical protein
MTYYLSSVGRDDYATLRFKTTPSTSKNDIRYRITNFNTIANINLTTDKDYVEFIFQQSQNVPHRFYFPNKSDYNIDRLVDDLNEIATGYFEFTLNDNGTLKITGDFIFRFTYISPRVALIFGATGDYSPSNTYMIEYDMPIKPILSLGNILYLTSNNTSIVGVNKDGNELMMNLAYKYSGVIFNGFPLVSKRKGPWINCKTSDFFKLEFRLVDFNFEPVVLKNPLFITIEMEPNNSTPNYSRN